MIPMHRLGRAFDIYMSLIPWVRMRFHTMINDVWTVLFIFVPENSTCFKKDGLHGFYYHCAIYASNKYIN